MSRGFRALSQGLTMSELANMSEELKGLKDIKLHEEGSYAFVVPKQIIRKQGQKYEGLPELIMAEEFANMPVTLEKDYKNYSLPEPKYRGVFNYDLNKHLIQNLIDFRNLIRNEEWFGSQTEEVKNRLFESKFFIKEEGKVQVVQLSSLVNENMTSGLIIDHMRSYTTDLIFYTDPQITYKLSPKDRAVSTSIYRRIETEEEAEMFGVEIGTSIETPWKDFHEAYNRSFNKIFIDPIRELHPTLDWKEFNKLPEVEAARDKMLVGRPTYHVVIVLNRIKTDNKDSIQITQGKEIPVYLNRMELKANQFKRFFEADPDSDIHFDPSFAIYKVTMPKREGDGPQSYARVYESANFSKPESTLRHGKEDERVPTIHPVDKEYSRRIKEALLDFPFRETYVTSGKQGYDGQMKLSAINEIIRNIALPIYKQLHEVPNAESTLNSMKYFLTNSLEMTEEELGSLQEGLKDAQFSGIPQQPQPPQQPQYAQQPQQPQNPQYAPVPPQQPQQPQQQYAPVPPQETHYAPTPPPQYAPAHEIPPTVQTVPVPGSNQQ